MEKHFCKVWKLKYTTRKFNEKTLFKISKKFSKKFQKISKKFFKIRVMNTNT